MRKKKQIEVEEIIKIKIEPTDLLWRGGFCELITKPSKTSTALN